MLTYECGHLYEEQLFSKASRRNKIRFAQMFVNNEHKQGHEECT